MNIEKVEKLVTNLYDKKEYAIHIGNLKQALYHGLGMKKPIYLGRPILEISKIVMY